MTHLRHCTLALLVAIVGSCAMTSPQLRGGGGVNAPVAPKPRVVVTADPELDDSNSLVRYLLYSTDFRTEGLIYASSGFHWKGDGTGKKWSVQGREYFRFGLNLCSCESWRWAPNERFVDDAVETYSRSTRTSAFTMRATQRPPSSRSSVLSARSEAPSAYSAAVVRLK